MTRDARFCYRGFHGAVSYCRIRIYEEKGKVPVVIVSELPDNPGTSITNRAEHIATEVYKLLKRPESGIELIEHYPDRAFIAGRPLFKERFDRVTFTLTSERQFTKPIWRCALKSEVTAFIGQPLRE